MKCISLLVAAAVAVLSVASTTHAAECTQEQLAAANSATNLDTLQTACASSLSLASSASVSLDPQGAAKKICADKPCMTAIGSLMANQPDCTILGTNFKDKYMSQFSTIQSACSMLGVPVNGGSSTSTSATTTSAPAVSSSARASTTLGVSVTLLAVGVAAVQL